VIIDAGVPVEPEVEDDAAESASDASEVVWTYVGSGAADGPKIALSIEVADQLQHYLRHVQKYSYGGGRHEHHGKMMAFLDELWGALAHHFNGGANRGRETHGVSSSH
jgi:hypothetical protein